MDDAELILDYAVKGISYKVISQILCKTFGLSISPNAVKKRLHKIGFSRRQLTHSRSTIKTAIENELKRKPQTVGYRSMTDTLRYKGYHVNRDLVMELMREIDPSGVEYRRRRRLVRKVYRSNGPNQTWHIDGYDKLTPYGFSIHGCIDGYSRKILWLSVGPSNKDPHVIATCFTKCVQDIGGCPMVLQADPGTENVVVGSLQLMFQDPLSKNSFRIVKSTFNQRIESWWSTFRRRCSEWWILFFQDLSNYGEFNRGNEFDVMCLRISFLTLLQKELDEVKDVWNYHYISRSRKAVVPNGKPAILYDLPEETGGYDCLVPVSDYDIEWAKTQCSQSTISGSMSFDEKAIKVLQESNFQIDDSWENCLDSYFHLRKHLFCQFP